MYTRHMYYLLEIKNHLTKEREKLVEALNHAKEARDDAPNAMESHSDTTRNQTEKLVHAFELKLYELDNLIQKIPNKVLSSSHVWQLKEIKLNGINMTIVIVPEGLGGRKIGELFLVSESSDLGKRYF